MKPFELMLLLFRVSQKAAPRSRVEADLWTASGIDKFVRTGKMPLIGSTARLILAAFIARAIALSPAELSPSGASDLRAYFKFRRACGFTELDASIESVYQEVVAPLWQPRRALPDPGDAIELVHPLTGEWARGRVIVARSGRVYANVGGVIAHLLASSVFWDGRGLWREAAKRDVRVRGPDREQARIFVTAADGLDFAAVRQSFAAPPASARVAPADRSAFLQIGRESMSTSPFRSEFQAKPVDLDAGNLMEGWQTFRGIVEPPFPKSERSARMGRHNPRQTQIVKSVVNVVPGRDYAVAQRYKRFNVRFMNAITGRFHYSWVTEDEIDRETADKLMRKFREHCAQKLRREGSVRGLELPTL
jgi:hypothetical protein